MTDRRRALGTRGEQAVARRYREAGYELLCANWRCARGEIDLVLGRPAEAGGPGAAQWRHRYTVVFCEVKTRASTRFGTGFEAVTTQKQRRLRRLGAQWLAEQRSGLAPVPANVDVRFDVATVTPRPDGGMNVEVLEGAF